MTTMDTMTIDPWTGQPMTMGERFDRMEAIMEDTIEKLEEMTAKVRARSARKAEKAVPA